MNQIAFTKNGLPLLIILFVCMPICSTGIVKREIQPSNTTKLIWQPIKIANNTSVNVTTTVPTEVTSSTTPRIISRRRTTTPATTSSSSTTTIKTTTEKFTTHATIEKNAEIILKDNVTVASVIDSQSTSDKNNLDDDVELISFGDVDGVTTEEQRFDLSR